MDEMAVAGPSRPRRRERGDNGGEDDVASKIAALQRQNASLVGIGIKDERKRQPGSPSGSKSRPRPHTSSAPRSERVDEYSRGSSGPSAARVLFDPSGAVPPPPRGDRRPGPDEREREREQEREREKSKRRAIESRRGEGSSSKKLFDPAVHDPRSFSHRQPSSAVETDPPITSSKLLFRRPVPGSGTGSGSGSRTSEMEADRERERRRRREGSERGSTMSGKKKEGDSRSKGSRSSEGSESFKDRERGKGRGDAGVKPILKKIHDEIKDLEQELTDIHRQMSQDPEAGISVLSHQKVDAFSREPRSADVDAAAWVKLIAKHKQLADLHDLFLTTLYDPLVPSSYHQLAIKYNIPSRLWQTAFFLILEQLRHAWISHHHTALDLLTDVVYDAYRFYTEMLENQALSGLRGAWIEALGDLARYRMTIASHVAEAESRRTKGTAPAHTSDDGDGRDELPVSSGASIGADVAQHWDVEDKETWRVTARDWYTMGITEKPGEGRLHHHLALLSRDVKGQEGRALHHFVKSLIITHEYATSRENILPLFDSALQSQRALPDATAVDLFIRLHGMLFTKISLDSFPSVLSRYMERLDEDASLDGVSRKATITQVDWMIMGVVNVAGVLQYGAVNGLIRKALAQEGAERRKAHNQALDEEDEDGCDGEPHVGTDAQPDQPVSEGDAPSVTFVQSLTFTFSVLSFVLAHPNRIQGFHQVLNPYITILLTFLATVFRQPNAGSHLLPYVPWHILAAFTNTADLKLVEEKRLASGAPLPEDWLIRGSEWVGRRVYERGFWKGKSPSGRGSSGLAQPQPRSGERFQSEMDVLLANFDSAVDIQEGVVDEADGADTTDGPAAVNQRRWKRVAWAVGVLAKSVDGLELRDGKLVVEGVLAEKIEMWERKKAEEEKEERERSEGMRREAERVELELELQMHVEEEGDADDDDLAELRRKLQDLRSQADAPSVLTTRKARKAAALVPISDVIPGYTMLVFDTNVMLNSLDMVNGIIESGQWSTVVPLPVVTELDGLSKDPTIGPPARSAVASLEQRIRTHALCLKIQTTKGNYLSDLLIRTEHHDPNSSSESFARTMDDRIVHIASFAKEHFVDRTLLLGMPKPNGPAIKVLLVSNDRNLRLKAKARGVDVANEKELGAVLARYK